MHQHAVAVDIAYLKRTCLGQTQSERIDRLKKRPVLAIRKGRNYRAHFVDGQNYWQGLTLFELELGKYRPVTLDGVGEEMLDPAVGNPDRRRTPFEIILAAQPVLAQVRFSYFVQRLAAVVLKLMHGAQIRLATAFRVAAQLEIFAETCIVVHG